jgi:hypothetical protein
VDSGINVIRDSESPDEQKVDDLIKAVREYLERFLSQERPDILTWLARMSLWHSFTVSQADANPWTLEQRVKLSLLEGPSAAGRYSMHLLVREAASKWLEDHPELKEKGREHFVRKMAEVGERLANLAGAEQMTTALEERLNCTRFCPIPDGLVENGELWKGVVVCCPRSQDYIG